MLFNGRTIDSGRRVEMNKSELGFILIELIAVIVILGVFTATAVPRFIDLSSAEQDEAIKNIAGILTNATSLNHAYNIAYDAGLTISNPFEITSCNSAEKLLESGLDKQYFIEDGSGVTIDDGGVIVEGGSSECLVTFDSNNDGLFSVTDEPSVAFTVYGVRN